MYREHRGSLYLLGDGRRALLYGALGVLAVTLTATDRLWQSPPSARSPGCVLIGASVYVGCRGRLGRARVLTRRYEAAGTCGGAGRPPDRRQLDRDAVEHRVARHRVDQQLVGEHVAVGPGVRRGHRRPRLGRVVTPAVGEADHARASPSSVISTSASTVPGPRAQPRPARRRVEPVALGVVGVDVQGALRRRP